MPRYRVQYTEIKPGGHRDRQDDLITADFVDCAVAELQQRRQVDVSTIRITFCQRSDGRPVQVYPVEPVTDFVRVRPGRYTAVDRPEVVIQREVFHGDVWGLTQWSLLVHGQRVAVRKTLALARAAAAAGLEDGRW